jgi:hypothetical protein
MEFDSLEVQILLIFTCLHRGGDMIKRRLQLIALFCCFIIGLSGCTRKLAAIGAVAAVGTGAYLYVKGDLKRNYEASIDKTWQAAVKSVEDLELSTESKENDAFNGIIKGKMANGKSFTVSVKRLGENLTEVGVRVGTFGDREIAEAIHDKILSNL